MSKEVAVSLVIGCGEQGLEWANKQKNGELTIGLDHKNIYNSNSNFRYGDVLNLPFTEKSVDRIYADFILNSVSVKNISFGEIKNNPFILMSESFPEIVRDWFVRSLNQSEVKVRENTEEIRRLLRTRALQEMMRVLKNNGEIFIIDRPQNVNWVKKQAVNVLGVGLKKIEIKELEINPDDYMRSTSLREISKDGEPLEKISLKKLY